MVKTSLCAVMATVLSILGFVMGKKIVKMDLTRNNVSLESCHYFGSAVKTFIERSFPFV